MKDKKEKNPTYSELEYESLRDECLEMAFILNKIEEETHSCAMCKGDYLGGYSTDLYLKTICEILYSSQGNHLKYKKSKQTKIEKGKCLCNMGCVRVGNKTQQEALDCQKQCLCDNCDDDTRQKCYQKYIVKKDTSIF